MPYEIRAENDVFVVYEDDVPMGILSCPYEQTVEAFEQEMREAGYALIRRDEIVNIDDFDVDELKQWNVFAIDPELDELDEDDGLEEDVEASES